MIIAGISHIKFLCIRMLSFYRTPVCRVACSGVDGIYVNSSCLHLMEGMSWKDDFSQSKSYIKAIGCKA